MTAEPEFHSENITPGVRAIIELTAIKVAEATVDKYESRLKSTLPRDLCRNYCSVTAHEVSEIAVKNHIDDCPFRRIMWMCLGGSMVLSIVGSFLFNLIKMKWS